MGFFTYNSAPSYNYKAVICEAWPKFHVKQYMAFQIYAFLEPFVNVVTLLPDLTIPLGYLLQSRLQYQECCW